MNSKSHQHLISCMLKPGIRQKTSKPAASILTCKTSTGQ